MAVQQGIVAAEDLRPELDRVRSHPFRRALAATLADIVGGSESLNELDCLAPSRSSPPWRGSFTRAGGVTRRAPQARRTPRGQIVRDATWPEFGVGSLVAFS